jgi:hypothetical protein
MFLGRADPNDFLSEGGKLWPPVQGVAREVGLLDNLRTITAGIRKAGTRSSLFRIIVGSLATTRPGTIRTHANSSRPSGRCSPKAAGAANGVRVSRRSRAIWSSRNTGGLDMLRKQHRIAKVIVIGLLAVHRNHRPIRDGIRVPRHAGEGRDRSLQQG